MYLYKYNYVHCTMYIVQCTIYIVQCTCLCSPMARLRKLGFMATFHNVKQSSLLSLWLWKVVGQKKIHEDLA